MSIDPNPETALTSTLRQLVNAVQLMQAAVDTLNVVIEANTDMSHILTSALSEIIMKDKPKAESAPTDSTTTTPDASMPGTSTAGATTDASPSAPPTTSQPVQIRPGSAQDRDRILRELNTILAEAEGDTSTWYAVIVGRNPGLFNGANGVVTTVTENVERIPGGRVIRYTTGRQDAIDGFNRHLEAGRVVRVHLKIERTVLQPGDSSIPGLQ